MQYTKVGAYADARAEFENEYNTSVGTLPDGRTVKARMVQPLEKYQDSASRK